MNGTSVTPPETIAATFWEAFFLSARPTAFLFGGFSLSFETILYWLLWLFVQFLIMLVSVFLFAYLGDCPSVSNNSQLSQIIQEVEVRKDQTHEARENLVKLHFKQVAGYGCSCFWVFCAPHLAKMLVPSRFLLSWVLYPLSTIEIIYLMDDFICKAQNWGSSRRAAVYFGIPLCIAHSTGQPHLELLVGWSLVQIGRYNNYQEMQKDSKSLLIKWLWENRQISWPVKIQFISRSSRPDRRYVINDDSSVAVLSKSMQFREIFARPGGAITQIVEWLFADRVNFNPSLLLIIVRPYLRCRTCTQLCTYC